MKKNTVIIRPSELAFLKKYLTEFYYKRLFRIFDIICVASSGCPGYYYRFELPNDTKSRSKLICLLRMITICAGNIRQDSYDFLKLVSIQMKLASLLIRI